MDIYVPELNFIIEYYELHHKESNSFIQKDKERETKLNKNYDFMIVEIGKEMESFNKIIKKFLNSMILSQST